MINDQFNGREVPIAHRWNCPLTLTVNGVTLPFYYVVIQDVFGNEYVIPAEKNPNVDSTPKLLTYYTVEDLIEASNGNAEKRKKIVDVHNTLVKKYDDEDMTYDRFADAYGFFADGGFVEAYNQQLIVKNCPPIDLATLPKDPTTVDLLAKNEEMIAKLFDIASFTGQKRKVPNRTETK